MGTESVISELLNDYFYLLNLKGIVQSNCLSKPIWLSYVERKKV